MPAARAVLAPYLLTRVLTAIVALAALGLFSSPTSCPDLCHRSGNPLLDAAIRWDAGAYIDIAHQGYGVAVPANNAYFPLYPLMGFLAAPLGGGDDAYVVAGIVISNLSLLAALVYLARLVTIDRDAAAGARAALSISWPSR